MRWSAGVGAGCGVPYRGTSLIRNGPNPPRTTVLEERPSLAPTPTARHVHVCTGLPLSNPQAVPVSLERDGPLERPYPLGENGNLLPNNQRQRRTCYALCHILYPVSAARTSIFRMDSNFTSYNTSFETSRAPLQGYLTYNKTPPPRSLP